MSDTYTSTDSSMDLDIQMPELTDEECNEVLESLSDEEIRDILGEDEVAETNDLVTVDDLMDDTKKVKENIKKNKKKYYNRSKSYMNRYRQLPDDQTETSHEDSASVTDADKHSLSERPEYQGQTSDEPETTVTDAHFEAEPMYPGRSTGKTPSENDDILSESSHHEPSVKTETTDINVPLTTAQKIFGDDGGAQRQNVKDDSSDDTQSPYKEPQSLKEAVSAQSHKDYQESTKQGLNELIEPQGQSFDKAENEYHDSFKMSDTYREQDTTYSDKEYQADYAVSPEQHQVNNIQSGLYGTGAATEYYGTTREERDSYRQNLSQDSKVIPDLDVKFKTSPTENVLGRMNISTETDNGKIIGGLSVPKEESFNSYTDSAVEQPKRAANGYTRPFDTSYSTESTSNIINMTHGEPYKKAHTKSSDVANGFYIPEALNTQVGANRQKITYHDPDTLIKTLGAKEIPNGKSTTTISDAVLGKAENGTDKDIAQAVNKNATEKATGKATEAEKQGTERTANLEKAVRQKFVKNSGKLIQTISHIGNSMLRESLTTAVLGTRESDVRQSYEKILQVMNNVGDVRDVIIGTGIGVKMDRLGLLHNSLILKDRAEKIAEATEFFAGLSGVGLEDLLTDGHLVRDLAMKSKGIDMDTIKREATSAKKSLKEAREHLHKAVESGDKLKIKEAEDRLHLAKAKSKDVNRKKSEVKKVSKKARLVGKYRKQVHTTVHANQAILDMAKKNPGLFTEEQLKHIQTGRFIKGAYYKNENLAIIQRYFSKSDNQMLKTLNPASMSVRDIKKVLKNKKHYVITSEQRILMKQAMELKRSPELKTHPISGRLGAIARIAKKGVRKLEQDDTIRTGANIIRAAKLAAGFIALGFTPVGKVLNYYGFYNPVSKAYRNFKRQVKETVKTKVKAATAPVVKKVRNSITKKTAPVIKKASNTKFVKNSKKVGKKLKKAGGKVKKAGKGVAKVLTKPFSLLNAVRTAIAKVIKWVGIIFFWVVVIYLILILLLSMIFDQAGAVAEANKYPFLYGDDIKLKIEHLNDLNDKKYEEAMRVAKGTPLNQQVFGGEKIYHYGSPTGPDDPKAGIYHNNISSEPSDNGYHIYYIDSKGDVIGSNTTNTKDIICLTSVMLYNNLYEDDSTIMRPEFTELIDKWSSLLNPDVTYVESDIYHTEGNDVFPHGTHTYDQDTYYCNDPAVYEKAQEIKSETVNGQRGGVQFYGSLAPQTEKGCEFDEEQYEEDMDDWRDNEPDAPEYPERDNYITMDRPDYSDYVSSYSYGGHSSYAFYNADAHRYENDDDDYYYDDDDDDYYSYDDDDEEDDSYYDSRLDDYHDDVERYNEMVEDYNNACEKYEKSYEEYEESFEEWQDEEPDEDDYWYCPGHPHDGEDDVPVSYGYKDINIYVTVLTKDDVFDAFETNNGILEYLVPATYELTDWDTKTVDLNTVLDGNDALLKDFMDSGAFNDETMVGWINEMCDQDWYSMYGVDVYRDSVGLDNGSGGLSERQLKELFDSYDGKVTSERQDFIEFALNYVGQIDFYYGGKPDCPGFEGNEFGKRIRQDKMKRSRKGLDSSGFVGWVYWSVFGEKPDMTTAKFASSLKLRKTTADRLIPGDIGYMNEPGLTTDNDMGIFVGYDETTGRAKWVHMTAKPTDNVVCNTTNAFRYYYSLGK